MAQLLVLEDFSGPLKPGRGGPDIIGAGSLLDEAQGFNAAYLLGIGCPIVTYDAGTMAAPVAAFNKMSGGVAQISPDGNLLALLIAAGAVGGGAAVGPANVVWLSLNGDDATGTRGDARYPFATMQAAVDAMLDFDQLRIGPGTFETYSGPFPAILQVFSIVGSGIGATLLLAPVGVDGLDFGGNLTRVRAELSGFTVSADVGGKKALTADGTGQGSTQYFTEGLILDGVSVASGDVEVTYGDVVVHRRSSFSAFSNMLYTSCSSLKFEGVSADSGNSIGIDFDCDDLASSGLAVPATFDGGCSVSLIRLLRQGGIDAAPGCKAETLTAFGLSESVAGAQVSRIIYRGFVTSVRLGNTTTGVFQCLPDSTSQVLVDFDGAIVGGAGFEVSVALPAANPQEPRLNANFSGGLLIGNGINANCLSAQFLSNIGFGATLVTAGTGTVKPPPFALASRLNASPLVWPLSFALTDANYVVTLDVEGGGFTGTIAKSTSDFTTDTAVVAGNISAVVSQI